MRHQFAGHVNESKAENRKKRKKKHWNEARETKFVKLKCRLLQSNFRSHRIKSEPRTRHYLRFFENHLSIAPANNQ